MNLLFAHDHRFLVDAAGRHFTTGSFPAYVWQRYLKVFDTITVLARIGDAPEGHNHAISSHPGVDFEKCADLNNLSSLLKLAQRDRRAIEDQVAKADAVIARLPSEIGNAVAKACQRQGKPYLIEVVGCAWDAYVNHGRLAGRMFAPLAVRRMRQTIDEAPLAIYVTKDWLQSRYPTRGVSDHVSNVEIPVPDEDVLALRMHRIASLRDGRPAVAGTIASLKVRYKGLQTAIPAIAKLRLEGQDIRFRILGSGDQQPWRRLAEEHGVSDLVTFDGSRPAGAAVFEWLDEIDIYLQPSFQEGLPRSTIEAMSRGCACVGSTAGGIPELLPAERTHAPGDTGSLARVIEGLARSPSKIEQAARRDIAVSQQYTGDLLQERRERMLRRLRDAAASNGSS
ncbi:glycosyltransferase [Altererythrobacter aurantiacus]|uniref:Glycosyltransferase n=1 Tax=Parapontixanthobacter aurantiacus TaxID=1463599 RepID=A0A844ZIH8_9SPHN|nr:glycosyltransferase [Parapontixanthobacter aurantiacus]MXO86780.1 glycosyltransferase [Parapontixanthobacter aurantiacus]